MGLTTTEGDTSLGYGSRCLYHTAAGLLQLSGVNVGSEERADAKQHFSRALKMAHKHLHNHQVVSQLLMMMAPLQVRCWGDSLLHIMLCLACWEVAFVLVMSSQHLAGRACRCLHMGWGNE